MPRKHRRTRVTARAMLDVIDAFLASEKTSPTEKRKLWNVLTALRGPDISPAGQVKRISTGPIRMAAFPRFGERQELAQFESVDLYNETELKKLAVEGHEFSHLHFSSHSSAAAGALSLPLTTL